MEGNATTSAVLALLVVTSVAAAFGGTAAAGHGAEFGNYTVSLPSEADHYPGDQGGQASIRHFAAGTQEAYDKAGAPEGYEKMSWIVISSNDIDFSNCGTANTAAFGIDRDNDDSGTNTDVDLLRYREGGEFGDNFISVNFYEGDELGAPPESDEGGKEAGRGDGDSNAELYPDDEIVAAQNDCYVMPEEPGWYQIDGKLNGTNWQGQNTTVRVPSHYFYICECASEEEARNELGPPPSEQGDDPTPTPESEDTPTPDGEDTPTADQQQQDETTDQQQQDESTDQQQQDESTDQQQQDESTPDGQGENPAGQAANTPTVGEGPGFGAGLALVALAGAALVALRRRR